MFVGEKVHMSMTGKIIGYDPGGNDRHGVAELMVSDGKPIQLRFSTLRNAQAAIRWFTVEGIPLAAGIDTLTVLSTGDSEWRPADRWLRGQYSLVQKSVVNPNYLQGSMALNGLALMVSLRSAYNGILISETHPKVLYFCLSGLRYDYESNRIAMNAHLSNWLGLNADTGNDHEWDAVVSCFAVFEGISGRWSGDLHQIPTAEGESLVQPSGPSWYYWPTSQNQARISKQYDEHTNERRQTMTNQQR